MSRSACKKATGGGGKPRIATGEHPSVGGERQRLALPIRHAAARAGDHRHERRIVLGLETRLHDEVDEPRREQAVGVAVAAEASELDRALETLESLGLGVL